MLPSVTRNLTEECPLTEAIACHSTQVSCSSITIACDDTHSKKILNGIQSLAACAFVYKKTSMRNLGQILNMKYFDALIFMHR